MKKILLFLSFLLMSIGVFSSTVTFTKSDFIGQGTPNTGSEVTATKGDVTFTYSKGYGADESLRCYAHGSLSITATSTITKINFTTTSGKTGGLSTEVEVNATNYTITDLASQARFTQITVTIGTSYTITEQSNNTTYGTVSLSGNVITGSPKSCCQYASPAYSVTSGTAIVSQSDNTFTVAASSNCTVQINFEEKPKYTISFNNAAGTNPESITQSACDESITLPDTAQLSAACSEMGWRFGGWTTKSNGEITSSDLVGISYIPTSNITLYAVFKKSEGKSVKWAKLTSNILSNGMNIVIVAPDAGKALYQETVSSSYVKYWDFNADDIDDDAKNYITLNASEEADEWYLGDATNGWLHTSGSTNYLNIDGTLKTSWDIQWSSTESKFYINSGRYLSCRSDLTPDNKYKFRLVSELNT